MRSSSEMLKVLPYSLKSSIVTTAQKKILMSF